MWPFSVFRDGEPGVSRPLALRELSLGRGEDGPPKCPQNQLSWRTSPVWVTGGRRGWEGGGFPSGWKLLMSGGAGVAARRPRGRPLKGRSVSRRVAQDGGRGEPAALRARPPCIPPCDVGYDPRLDWPGQVPVWQTVGVARLSADAARLPPGGPEASPTVLVAPSVACGSAGADVRESSGKRQRGTGQAPGGCSAPDREVLGPHPLVGKSLWDFCVEGVRHARPRGSEAEVIRTPGFQSVTRQRTTR